LIESHDEKHKEEHEEKHKEKHEGKHKEKHEGKHEEKHDEKHDEKTWRSFDFDRESWRENMVESHEGKSCRLFDQAIYIYLIFCWVESSFRVELSSQASQLNSSAWVQLLNPTRHFFKKIPTRLDTFRVEYSTWRDQSINEMIDKIVDCKYLTRLNIILTFNKLRMHFDSENYTIFIIALKAYKSKILFFELINDSVSFQQYINNVL